MQYSHLLQNFLVSIEEKKKGRGETFVSSLTLPGPYADASTHLCPNFTFTHISLDGTSLHSITHCLTHSLAIPFFTPDLSLGGKNLQGHNATTDI